MSRRSLQLFHVNAFTRELYAGNSAGVVLDADELTTEEMQSIARELGHSETAFVMEQRGDDVLVRFFTPATEVPVCGHATIAAHYVRAKLHGRSSGSVRQRCGVGVIAIDFETVAGDVRVRMHQRPPNFVRRLSGDEAQALVSALGLAEVDLDPRCPVEIVDTGHAKALLGLRDSTVLNAIVPDSEALVALSRAIRCNGFHVFTLSPDASDVLTECRMFAPAIGIDEDPVTGNGNGPMGAYLVRHRLVSHDGQRLRFASLQGRVMGRPGIARVEVEVSSGEPASVAVLGDAVIFYRGEINL